MKIGIFGGCFNPVHKMHKKIANHLIDNNYIDTIIIVPTGKEYNKPNLETELNRYNMLNILFENNPKIKISDYEFGKIKHTYQTLEHFKKINKDDEIYFITGTDNLKQINTWDYYDYILDNYKILSIKRDNENINEIEHSYKKYLDNIEFINIKSENISSSSIRNQISQKGYDNNLNNYIDLNVLNYMKFNNMYKNKKLSD